MERYSRPATFDHLKTLITALNKNGVDAFVVDIMLNACGETYDSLQQYAETIDLDGVPVRTDNLQGLLLTKQTMRDKDIADRIVPQRALAALSAHPGTP